MCEYFLHVPLNWGEERGLGKWACSWSVERGGGGQPAVQATLTSLNWVRGLAMCERA